MSRLEKIRKAHIEGDWFDNIQGERDIAWLLACTEALGRLVDIDPYTSPNEGNGWFCWACGGHDTKGHTAECAWQQARELLSRDEQGTQP